MKQKQRKNFCQRLSKDMAEDNQAGFWHKVDFGMRPAATRAALRIVWRLHMACPKTFALYVCV